MSTRLTTAGSLDPNELQRITKKATSNNGTKNHPQKTKLNRSMGEQRGLERRHDLDKKIANIDSMIFLFPRRQEAARELREVTISYRLGNIAKHTQ